jgi:hypothetical protein
MAGLEGVLVRKKNNFRVVLALDVIMRSVAVEVDADDLEPAANYGGRVIPVSQLSGQSIRFDTPVPVPLKHARFQ